MSDPNLIQALEGLKDQISETTLCIAVMFVVISWLLFRFHLGKEHKE